MNKRIIFTNYDGSVGIVTPSGEVDIDTVIKQAVPEGLAYEIVGVEDIPTDRTFRNAWEHDTTAAPQKVATNLPKAKAIAHEVRRSKRTEAFAPLDTQATVPALATKAEAARQAIRDADAQKQVEIDSAADEAALKEALNA